MEISLDNRIVRSFGFGWIYWFQSHSNGAIDATIVTHGCTPVLPWRENLVYPIWQSSFVKLSGIQARPKKLEI
jgi:hypothetical protein